ncbi:MAG: carbohydrate deacetylase [bacterium]
MRRLIVNADDFGLSPGVNRGIIAAHEHGIVTSTSLLVRGGAAAAAAAYGRAHPRLSVGLHVDLGEWVYRDGEWVMRYEVVPAADAAAVAADIDAQLAAFRRLLGRDPTHLDSHQHVHRDEPARGILERLGRALSVPVRGRSPAIHYCGGFYGQTDEGESVPGALSTEALIAILRDLPDGVTEMACHPGDGDDSGSTYGAERAQELRTLCDPGVRKTLESLEIQILPFGTATAPIRPE